MTETTHEPANDLRERDLQKHVRAMLAQFGWKVAVTWSSLHSPKGWPDLFAVRCDTCRRPDCEYPGMSHASSFCAIELKAEKGKVSDEQKAWLEALGALPGAAFAGVVRPSMWFAGELDDMLR